MEGNSASHPVPRITLTLPVINEAKYVLFLVSGSKKREVFHQVLDNPGTSVYPAARVEPSGRLVWFINEELA